MYEDLDDSSSDSIDLFLNNELHLRRNDYYNSRGVIMEPTAIPFKRAFKQSLEDLADLKELAEPATASCIQALKYSTHIFINDIPYLRKCIVGNLHTTNSDDKYIEVTNANSFNEAILTNLKNLFCKIIDFDMLEDCEQKFLIQCFLRRLYASYRIFLTEMKKKEQSDSESTSQPLTETSQQNNEKENLGQNKSALNYVAGFVLTRVRHWDIHNKQVILNNFVEDLNVPFRCEEQFLANVTRGKLTRITKEGFKFFEVMDNLVKCDYDSKTPNKSHNVNLKEKSLKVILKSETVLQYWNKLTNQSNGLARVVKTFLKIKGKGLANALTEKHQCNTKIATKASKGLRPTLRQLEVNKM